MDDRDSRIKAAGKGSKPDRRGNLVSLGSRDSLDNRGSEGSPGNKGNLARLGEQDNRDKVRSKGQGGPIGRATGQPGRAGGGQPGIQQDPGVNDYSGENGGRYGGYAGGDRNNWWIDTGNNSTAGPRNVAPPDTSPVASDPEATYQQGMSDLSQLRQAVQGDPETLQEVQELIRELARLDPKRFPGNPALVEELHTQVLNDVDKLELQLSRQADDKDSGKSAAEIRSPCRPATRMRSRNISVG